MSEQRYGPNPHELIGNQTGRCELHAHSSFMWYCAACVEQLRAKVKTLEGTLEATTIEANDELIAANKEFKADLSRQSDHFATVCAEYETKIKEQDVVIEEFNEANASDTEEITRLTAEQDAWKKTAIANAGLICATLHFKSYIEESRNNAPEVVTTVKTNKSTKVPTCNPDG